jgi:hypothetical protein
MKGLYPTSSGSDSLFLLFFLTAAALTGTFVFDHWPFWTPVCLVLNILALAGSFLRAARKSGTAYRNAGLGLLLISFLLSGFPFDSGNPFNFFKGPVFQNLFTLLPAALSVWVADQRGRPEKLRQTNFRFPLAFLVLLNTFFALLDYRDLLPFDSSRHLLNALNMAASLQGNGGMKIWEVLTYYDFYQPLSYLAPFPFFMVFGKSHTSAVLCQTLFWLPLTALGFWKTLRFLRVNPSLSGAVIFLILSGSLSSSLLRHFMQDFPVLCLLTWFQYALLRSRFFTSRLWTIRAGFLLGAGILTKASFLFFTVGLPVFATILIISGPRLRNRFPLALERILQLIFPVVITAGFWFWVNQSHYSYELPSMKNFARLNKLPNAEELASVWWYWKRLHEAIPVWVLLPGLALPVLWTRLKHRLRKTAGLGWLSFFLSLWLISFIPNKDLRTLFPLQAFLAVPAAAVLGALAGVPSRLFWYTGVAWQIVSAYTLAFGWEWKAATALQPRPFVVLPQPEPPSTPSPNLSYYRYQRLWKACFPDSAAPGLLFGEQDNYHARGAFAHLIPEPVKHDAGKNKPAGTILFTRNAFWPDHYLWNLAVHDSTLILNSLARYQEIDGDLILEVYWLDEAEKPLHFQSLPLGPDSHTHQFPVFPGSKKIRYGLYIHHTHPRGQWVQLIYDLLKHKEYHSFRVPLLLYQPQGPPVETGVMRLPGV